MSYVSFSFFLFLAAVTAVYFLFPVKKYQWIVLLIASYVFYLMAGYRYAAFIVITTISTYLAALVIDKIAVKGKEELKAHKADWDKDQKKQFKAALKKKKYGIMLGAVVLNLGILAFLKYYNFFAGSLNDLFAAGGMAFSAPTLKLFLPLGISFYTFQSVGYVVDVYRDKIRAEKNPLKLALFVSFFPQIIQGPISFYDQLATQLYEPHRFDFTRAKHGASLILWGLFKKLVIADRAFIAIDTVLEDYSSFGGTTLTFTVLLYALQLYTDFSGGIDISRGAAQILGIDMTENFLRPYFATSISAYWRRWHISLGAWMKEYVFYPLALSKGFTNVTKAIRGTKFGATKVGAHIAKVLPTSFASLIVFLLVGVWHGANWKYVAFGLWNGGVIMLSTLMEPIFAQTLKFLRIKATNWLLILFQMLRTFLIVAIGYVFDIAPNFAESMRTFRLMVTDQNLEVAKKEILTLGLAHEEYVLISGCTVILLFVSIIQECYPDTTMRAMLDRRPFILRYLVWLIGMAIILLFGVYGPGYDATAFAYMQF